MNLQKAIEFNKDVEKDLRLSNFSDHADAVKLGSEAIKVLLHGRLIGAHHDPARLPGETEE